MNIYTKYGGTRVTPQRERIPNRPDMVKNSAGGYTFAIDKWAQLDRWLILGSCTPTLYASAKELTLDNLDVVRACIAEDGTRTVRTIVEVSQAGRAPKNDQAVFALALCLKEGDLDTRRAAAAEVRSVCRIGTHLFHFIAAVRNLGGMGKLTKRALQSWYLEPELDRLAYQLLKYQRRDGWSHRDVLRLVRPKAGTGTRSELLGWAVNGWPSVGDQPHPEAALRHIWAKEVLHDRCSRDDIVWDMAAVCQHIVDYRLTREMVPTQLLNEPQVWDALLVDMPLNALIRNLGKMSNVGLLKPMSSGMQKVLGKLGNTEVLRRSRLHPLAILQALAVYRQGKGIRGKLSWTPLQQVVDALDAAFYQAFDNVPVTGKNWMLGIDVSGSMNWGAIAGMEPISPGVAAAAMAMVTARTEPVHHMLAFSGQPCMVGITAGATLLQVHQSLYNMGFGRTDCALPMVVAAREKYEVDVFVVYTDNETGTARCPIHPCQALEKYRQKMGRDAKLIVCGMTSTGFSIADPRDARSLDVVGFGAATPRVMADFVLGNI